MRLDEKAQRELKRKQLVDAIWITWLLYLVFGGFLYFNQRDFMYFPDRKLSNLSSAGAQAHSVRTEDGVGLIGWYIEPKPGKPVAVLFHGNAGSIDGRALKAEPFTKRGMGFLFAEYRGYGGNPGKPTEENLYEDARTWLAALEREGIPRSDIILYGESLGTGVAVKMAAERPGHGGMILESPYTSFPAIARVRYPVYPVHLMVLDKYDSLSRIEKVMTSTLIIHGRNDMLVPLSHGAALAHAMDGRAQLVVLDNVGHNDLYAHGAPAAIGKFLDETFK